MNGVPSSTYFTVSPEWGWLITLYFFFGGLAGGAYFARWLGSGITSRSLASSLVVFYWSSISIGPCASGTC